MYTFENSQAHPKIPYRSKVNVETVTDDRFSTHFKAIKARE